jgi:hypothetical protein
MTTKGEAAFAKYAEKCPNLVKLEVERRPGNALNVEIGTPIPRCKLCPPPHWRGASVTRWLLSGGSPLVLGACTRVFCPLKPDHCDACGHTAELHTLVSGGCIGTAAPGEKRFPCYCTGTKP